jgi:Arc/MetJ family transcription regulator
MATNVHLDDDLISEAQRLGKHRSKRATIEEALREYVQRRKQLEILHLFGQIDYDDAYNYKSARHRQ